MVVRGCLLAVLVMLIRFCTHYRSSLSHSPEGVFQAAFELRNQGKLEQYEEDWLEEELRWLRMHLPSPGCLREDGNERAICWFKPDAQRAIEKVRGIVALLETKDVFVQQVATAQPGAIIYEDKWQVVAKPWRRGAGKRRYVVRQE